MLGKELKDWRVRNNLTQARAAKGLGTSLQSYKRWELYTNREKSVPESVAIIVAMMAYYEHVWVE